MSEKLPSGWANTFDNRWKHVNGASAEIYHLDGWFIAVASAPKRATKEEAEKDRLNLIAGLGGGADLLNAREQIDTLTSRLDRAAELHDAIVKCLNAIGAPQKETIPWRIGAWQADVEALIASLERQLEEKSSAHRGALTVVQRLREERDAMRTTIAKQQYQIDRIKSTACDAAPQLLRDSMRVTQEESARIKADMARKDAEIATLRQRVTASEAYAQHLLAALNAVSGFKGPQ